MYRRVRSIIYPVLICLISINIIFLIRLDNRISYLNRNTFQANSELSFTLEKLVEKLKVYNIYDQDGPLKLVRHGKAYDGGYVVAEKALDQADVLLGYGIADDNSFEDQFSLKYNKPSYGFDCGIDHIDGKSKLFTFVKECIATDSFLYDKANSNSQVTSFEEQLEKFNLKNKKLFIKMDIEGAEYYAFNDIRKYKENITGISLEVHFDDYNSAKMALDLLKKIEEDFILIHVHGNNYAIRSGFMTSNSIGVIPNVIELSYINKNLVNKFMLSSNQSHPLKIDQPNNRMRLDANFTIMH